MNCASIHVGTEGRIDHLVSFYWRLPSERAGNHADLEMISGPRVVTHLRLRTGDGCLDAFLNF